MNLLTESTKIMQVFSTKNSEILKKTSELSEKLYTVCGKLERTWSGSFAGWHGRMYFLDFQIPSVDERFSGEWGNINGIPEGWEEKQTEDVRDKVNELMENKFSVEKFEEEVKNLRKKRKNYAMK